MDVTHHILEKEKRVFSASARDLSLSPCYRQIPKLQAAIVVVSRHEMERPLLKQELDRKPEART